MKATELRIGNITSAGVVEGIKFTNAWYVLIDDYWKEVSEIEPVPITEEWLIKFGFGLYHGDTGTWGKSGWTFSKTNGNYRKDTGDHILDGFWYLFISDKNQDTLPRAQFVHQLQNLYFSLTGEELTEK